MSLGEIVQLQFGQCGNRIGGEFFSTVASEHGLDSSCHLLRGSDAPKLHQMEGIGVYFAESQRGEYFPRAVAVDPWIHGREGILRGPFGSCYRPENICHGTRLHAHSNWAEGYYSTHPELVFEDVIRREAERCSNLQGFQFIFGVGGSGAGFAQRMMEQCRNTFHKMSLSFAVMPEIGRQPVFQSSEYDTVLSLHYTNIHSDTTILVDNPGLAQLSRKLDLLNTSSPTSSLPTSFDPLNLAMSRIMSDVTAPFRFPSLSQRFTSLADFIETMRSSPPDGNCLEWPSFLTVGLSSPSTSPKLPSLCRDMFHSSNVPFGNELGPKNGHVRVMATLFRTRFSTQHVESYMDTFRSESLPPHLCTTNLAISEPLHVNSITDESLSPESCRSLLVLNSSSLHGTFRMFGERLLHARFSHCRLLAPYRGYGMGEWEVTEADSAVSNDFVGFFGRVSNKPKVKYSNDDSWNDSDDEEEEEEEGEREETMSAEDAKKWEPPVIPWSFPPDVFVEEEEEEEEEVVEEEEEEETTRISEDEDWILSPSSVDCSCGVVLGKGAFGKVVKGVLRVGLASIDVAVKEILLAAGTTIEQVKHEVKVLASLQHENILKCFGCYFTTLARGYQMTHVVLELIVGGELLKFMKANRYSGAQRLDMTRQIALALRFIHASGIVHRDLKHENIIIQPKRGEATGIPKICDFGLSKNQGSAARGTVCGTPGYIPNPKHASHPDVFKHDVFAFGILAWETLVMAEFSSTPDYQQCWERVGRDPSQFVYAMAEQEIRPPMVNGLPAVLFKVLQKCWSDHPEDRPTMTQVCRLLHRIMKKPAPDFAQPTVIIKKPSTVPSIVSSGDGHSIGQLAPVQGLDSIISSDVRLSTSQFGSRRSSPAAEIAEARGSISSSSSALSTGQLGGRKTARAQDSVITTGDRHSTSQLNPRRSPSTQRSSIASSSSGSSITSSGRGISIGQLESPARVDSIVSSPASHTATSNLPRGSAAQFSPTSVSSSPDSPRGTFSRSPPSSDSYSSTGDGRSMGQLSSPSSSSPRTPSSFSCASDDSSADRFRVFMSKNRLSEYADALREMGVEELADIVDVIEDKEILQDVFGNKRACKNRFLRKSKALLTEMGLM